MSRRAGLLLLPVLLLFFLLFAWPTLGSDDAHDLFEHGRELMADRRYAGPARALLDLPARYPTAAEAAHAPRLLGRAHPPHRAYHQAAPASERPLSAG